MFTECCDKKYVLQIVLYEKHLLCIKRKDTAPRLILFAVVALSMPEVDCPSKEM